MDIEDPQVRRLVHEVAEETARQTVRQTLTSIGVDVHNPLAVQRDLAYLRQLRESSALIGRRGLMTAAGLFVAGICAALWAGLRHALGGGQ